MTRKDSLQKGKEMKRYGKKKIGISCVLATILLLPVVLEAQVFTTVLTQPANGGNRKAVVGERIGITDVLINYHRPGVKGREGKIYGTGVVHKGFTKPGAGTSKAAPWRAGANENTTMSVSTDVTIEGKHLPAGTYGFFVAYDDEACILIFSKHSTAWGHFFYDEKNDALRVNVKPQKIAQSSEWLKYEFIDQKENSATVALMWEKLLIPFKVEVDLVKTQIESFRKELTGDKAFLSATAWNVAADFCLKHKVNFDEAIQWADQAIFWSGNSFGSNVTKVRLLKATAQDKEAALLEQATIARGTMTQLSSYGGELLKEKQYKEAMAVFELNSQKHPNQFLPLSDMSKLHSATGDNKAALEYAKKALPLATDSRSKASIETMIKTLTEGNP